MSGVVLTPIFWAQLFVGTNSLSIDGGVTIMEDNGSPRLPPADVVEASSANLAVLAMEAP